MSTIKLSLEVWYLRWTEFCIDWFMNFFADPDYYWVEETYPNKRSKSKIINISDLADKNKVVLKEALNDNQIFNVYKKGRRIFRLTTKCFFVLVNELAFRIKQIFIINNYIWS